MNLQRGQSLTEFAVAVAGLSLLLLGTVAIGGYQQIDRRLLVAARQEAYQSIWLAGRGDAADRTRRLHDQYFSDAGAQEPTGRRALVETQALSVEHRVEAPAGAAGQVAQTMLAPLRVASSLLGTGFDLTATGFHRGQLRAQLAPLDGLPPPFDTLELQLQARYATLGDAWHAGGVAHVRQRAGALVPASALAGFSDAFRPLLAPLALIEPSIAQFCPGIIEPDRVPADRLGRGSTALPGRCP